MSDGTYYWRSDAVEYVRQYGIDVGAEGLQHMRASNWIAPKMSDAEVLAVDCYLADALRRTSRRKGQYLNQYPRSIVRQFLSGMLGEKMGACHLRRSAPYTTGLRYESEEVASRLGAGDAEIPLMPLDETILIMETVDAVLAQARGDA